MTAAALKKMGHPVGPPAAAIGGGMSMVMYADGGGLAGACCWRADGTAVGLGGGYAMPGARFSTGSASDAKEKARL